MVPDKRGPGDGAARPGGTNRPAAPAPPALHPTPAAPARVRGNHLPTGRPEPDGARAGGGALAVTPAQQVLLQVDATPGNLRGLAGIGVVVRGPYGRVLTWRTLRATTRCSAEAEYHAVIAGLEVVLTWYPHAQVRLLSDHQAVVEQLNGRSVVRAERLQPLYARAIELAARLPGVEYVTITRDCNRLADALAWEALDGRGALLRASRR